jgi:hypothetical protein
MLMVRRVYTPAPGQGGKLLAIVRQIRTATTEAGLPPLTVFRQALGYHGTLVTEQKWPSMAAYEESRERLRQTKQITQLFEQVYPLLASTHLTEMYDEIG